MPTSNPQVTDKSPYKVHPALLALFAGTTILWAVLFAPLPKDSVTDTLRLRKDTRRDLQDLLDTLRHE